VEIELIIHRTGIFINSFPKRERPAHKYLDSSKDLPMDIQQQLELNALYEDMAPMGAKKVAVVIGRFNPPTKGHYAVIDLVKKFIRENKKLGLEAAPVVVVIGGSKSDSDKKRNPLTVDERLVFMKSSGLANGVTFMSATNAFSALAQLRDQGMEPIAIAAGTDRIDDYMRILNKHFLDPNGKTIKHYKVLLDRDSGAITDDKDAKKAAMDSALSAAKAGKDIDTDIVSGSLARRAVELGYEPEFAKIVGLEAKPALAKKMFDKIKAAIAE
jgi:hypothetical protein